MVIGRPWAVEVGRDGYLYAVDGGDQDPDKPRSGLLVLSREGEVIARWSRYGYCIIERAVSTLPVAEQGRSN